MGPGQLIAKSAANRSLTPTGRFFDRVRALVFGRPLSTEAEIGEHLPEKKAIGVVSSDAISSAAYATEEILRVLLLAGVGALLSSIHVAVAITVLLVVVESPYRTLVGPMLAYLDVLDAAWPPDKSAPITFVVLPEYVARSCWERSSTTKLPSACARSSWAARRRSSSTSPTGARTLPCSRPHWAASARRNDLPRRPRPHRPPAQPSPRPDRPPRAHPAPMAGHRPTEPGRPAVAPVVS